MENGVIAMLERNRRIKPCPEKFEIPEEGVDIIICCEVRVYDQVLTGRLGNFSLTHADEGTV